MVLPPSALLSKIGLLSWYSQDEDYRDLWLARLSDTFPVPSQRNFFPVLGKSFLFSSKIFSLLSHTLGHHYNYLEGPRFFETNARKENVSNFYPLSSPKPSPGQERRVGKEMEKCREGKYKLPLKKIILHLVTGSSMKGQTTQIPVQFFWEKECWGKWSQLHLERSMKTMRSFLHNGRGYYMP